MTMTSQQRMFPARSPLPPPLVVDLRRVCAWCELVISEGAEPTSHGICTTCADTFREKHNLPRRSRPSESEA